MVVFFFRRRNLVVIITGQKCILSVTMTGDCMEEVLCVYIASQATRGSTNRSAPFLTTIQQRVEEEEEEEEEEIYLP